jgi:hypothetical protein
VAALFHSIGSASLPLTLTLLVIDPVVPGVTTIVTLAVPPLGKFPTSQATAPADGMQLPWLGVAETKVTLDGNVSVTVTRVAAEGPLLVTVTV